VENHLQHPVFSSEGFAALDAYLKELTPSKTFLLVDSNTSACIPAFASQLSQLDPHYEVLEVEPGEDSKSIEVASGLWSVLLEYGADRNSILINLGGGMVLDLGGFVASTFKRGIPFINVPTSLLAMVDASVGGKTGINIDGLKNQVGTFTHAALVLVEPSFLDSLPEEEWHSGHGEMIKHALLSGRNWPEILGLNREALTVEVLQDSIQTKVDVVAADFKELGLRKTLNLGHTFGHAWESFHLAAEAHITHGAAVIQGLHLALSLSNLRDVQQALQTCYPWTAVASEYYEALWMLMQSDKKNEGGTVKFVLLEQIGRATWGHEISKSQFFKALDNLNGRG
jgi:3-dehydroquinate synthase